MSDDATDDLTDDTDDRSPLSAVTAHATLVYLTRAIVDDPDGVQVVVDDSRDGEITLRLTVAQGDMGRVIGKRGRVAQAIRQVVRAAATNDGVKVSVDIVD